MAGRGLALPLQPDLLAGGDAGRNLDVELLAGRQPDALLAALDRLLQRHRHGDVEIEVEPRSRRCRIRSLPPAAGRAAARRAAEHAVEDVLEAAAAASRPAPPPPLRKV